MNEVSLNRAGELTRGVIEILWSKPEGLPSREIIASIPEIIKLTEYETGISPSTHKSRYDHSIRLAIIPLVKAGWLSKTDKGQWRITEAGRAAVRRFANTHDFYTEALRLADEGKQGASELFILIEAIEEIAWEYVSRYMQTRSLMDIRRLVMLLLEALQYHIIWVAPPEKTRGLIDLIANTDPLGTQPCRIVVQIRHKGQAITAEGLKSFLTALGHNDFGLLLSTGGFTHEAREELTKSEYQKINAMDLAKFYDIWIKQYDKLSRKAHDLLPLRKKMLYFLSQLD